MSKFKFKVGDKLIPSGARKQCAYMLLKDIVEIEIIKAENFTYNFKLLKLRSGINYIYHLKNYTLYFEVGEEVGYIAKGSVEKSFMKKPSLEDYEIY